MGRTADTEWLEGIGFARTLLFDVDAFNAAPLGPATKGRKVAEGWISDGGGSFGDIYKGAWRGHEIALFQFNVVRRGKEYVSGASLEGGHTSYEPYICATIEIAAELPPIALENGREPEVSGDEALTAEVFDPVLREQVRVLSKDDLRGLGAGGRYALAYRAGFHVAARDQGLLDAVAELRERLTDSILARHPLPSGAGPGAAEPW